MQPKNRRRNMTFHTTNVFVRPMSLVMCRKQHQHFSDCPKRRLICVDQCSHINKVMPKKDDKLILIAA